MHRLFCLRSLCALAVLALAAPSAAETQLRLSGGRAPHTRCVANVSCDGQPQEFWVINTRCAPVCCDLDRGFHCISYQRYDPAAGAFVRESLASFLAVEAGMPTMIHIHGNANTHEDALEHCWRIFDRIRNCPGPKRLVCWSWPSERELQDVLPPGSLRQDFLVKLGYAENQGYYLARIIQQMSMAQPVTLTGHSFGGGAAVSTLHYLGGGMLNGRMLEGGYPATHVNVRAAVIAGAFDDDDLLPGQRYGQALVAAETLYLTVNPADAVLRHWPQISPRRREAVGCVGLPTPLLGPLSYKLRQERVTRFVGRQHRFNAYLYSDAILRELCRLALTT